jgi:hypothetical protein
VSNLLLGMCIAFAFCRRTGLGLLFFLLAVLAAH